MTSGLAARVDSTRPSNTRDFQNSPQTVAAPWNFAGPGLAPVCRIRASHGPDLAIISSIMCTMLTSGRKGPVFRDVRGDQRGRCPHSPLLLTTSGSPMLGLALMIFTTVLSTHIPCAVGSTGSCCSCLSTCRGLLPAHAACARCRRGCNAATAPPGAISIVFHVSM